MGAIFNLIKSVIEWGVFLAAVGGLGEATLKMYKEAGQAHSHGLISLSKLNRQLISSETSNHH